MSVRLCVRLSRPVITPTTEVDWALYDDERCVVRERSELHAISRRMPDERGTDFVTSVICPGESVMTTSVKIPSKQNATLRKALPYVIEEQLACALEETHLATAPLGETDDVHVAVVAHGDMIAWIDTLYRVGLVPNTVYVDYLVVPFNPGELSVFLGGPRALVRLDEYHGISVLIDQLDRVVGLILAERGESIHSIQLLSSVQDEQGSEQAQRFAEDFRKRLAVTIERVEYRETPLEILADTAVKQGGDVLNLCQGGYSPKLRGGTKSNYNLKPFAIGIAATLLMYFGVTLGSGWWMKQQARGVEDQARALYREFFPNDRRVVSIRRQMESHLRGEGGGGANEQFLPLIARLGAVMEQQSGDTLALTQIRYDADNGALNLELTADNMSSLDSVQQRLGAEGLAGRLISANERDGGLSARLEVRRS